MPFSDLSFPTLKEWSWRLIDRLTFNIVNQVTLSSVTPFKSLFIYFLPELILVSGILYILSNMAFKLATQEPKKMIALESLLALRISLFITGIFYLLYTLNDVSCSVLFNHFSVNSYSSSLKTLLIVSGLFIVELSWNYILKHNRHLLEYPVILALSIFFMLLLMSSTHLLTAFLSLVGFSLNLYVLILFDVDTHSAREAGIKYYYLSTFSSGLIAMGVFLLFFIAKVGNFSWINLFLTQHSWFLNEGEAILTASTLFLLIGLFFKLSAFPGHLWAVEVYDGSPAPIMGFFMVTTKIAVLTFTLNLLTQALDSAMGIWQPLVSIAALGSIIWGCFGAFYEKKIKRFLAYTSVNQIGFLLIGLACGTLEGYRTTLLYLHLYALMTLGFLNIFLTLRRADKSYLIYLTDLRGFGIYRESQWLKSWSLVILLFSMAGIPPLAGFFGKYFLLLHAHERGLWGLVFIALATSLISAYYYLRLVKILWFENSTHLSAPLSITDLATTPTGLTYPGRMYVLVNTDPAARANNIIEAFLWIFIIIGGGAVTVMNKLIISGYLLTPIPLLALLVN